MNRPTGGAGVLRPSLIAATGSEERATAAVFSGRLDWPVPPAAWLSADGRSAVDARLRR
jgi:hypothetical protein